MELQDIFLTPVYLVFIYAAAYAWRRRVTDSVTRRYFIPALTAKIVGAIALGLIYQFYYGGGDTFNFFRDSSVIWRAFVDAPDKALRIIFSDNTYHADLYEYTRQIYFYVDPHTFNVIRVSGFIGLFTFHTYSAIAIFFAAICFSGMWAMYQVFYRLYPHLHKPFAIAIFFMPSVFFWGSGLMKDTITLGALGWMFYGFYFGCIRRERVLRNVSIVLVSLLIIQSIKVYILLCFLPAAFLWVFLEYRARIHSPVIRFLSWPLIIAVAVPLSYRAVVKVTEDNARYQLENIVTTTTTTATWLRTVGTMQGGSVYSLGEFDGTWSNMLAKAPQAILVTLYRPFLWEVRNPVMLLSALEAAFFLFLTLRIFWEIKLRRLSGILTRQPILLFCLLFSLTFAFAVGISSYNFGTLVRYKIPMMPFFLAMLYIVRSQASVKKSKKLRQFA